LERECSEFIESVKIVQRSCDQGALSDPNHFHPEDRSLKLILSFLHEAQKKTKNLSALYEATISTEFDGVMRYFGEDPIDKSARAAFFKKFADFMTQYQTAKKENLDREDAKRKDEARKKVLGTAQKTAGGGGAGRDARTVEANNKIMDDLLDKLRGAPKDSSRHQRRRAARRNVSGSPALKRSISGTSNLAPSSPIEEGSPTRPAVTVTAPIATEDGEELDLGKVAQGLLAGLKGGDDLLASFREARKSVNASMMNSETSPVQQEESSVEEKED
jgi:cytokinesis protein